MTSKRTQVAAQAYPVIFFHHVEHKNDSFCVHPLGNSQRVLTKGVGQRGTLRLKSSHFKHNVGGSQGLPDKPFPQGSHEQDVNNARKKRAEHSAEASRRKLDHESTQRIVRGQENKLLLLEGGPWMRALRIVFGLLIAVVCACTVPPRAFAAGRGSNGATISKVTVGEKGAPEKAQPFEIKVLKERTGHATSAGGLADLGIEDDESGEIAASEVKMFAALRRTLVGHLTEYHALVQSAGLKGHHTRFKLPESMSKEISTLVFANRKLEEELALLHDFQGNIDTYLTSLTKALALCSKNGLHPSHCDPSKDAYTQVAKLGAGMDVVDSDLGEALRQHEESASLLRVCYVRYNMLLLMRMVEMDATIRLIWRRSEDQEMIAKARALLKEIEEGLQSVDNIRTAILLGARKSVVDDQSIPRESMLLLRMLASGHQLQLLAFELKRVAADLGVVSNALFNCRRNSIEACKVIHEASERPPIGSWEAVWKHFAELEHTEALHTVIVSRLLQTIDSLRIAGE